MAHTPFSGTPYTTGAVTASSVGTGIPKGSILPGATTYPSNGQLNNPEPAPYVPAGGLGTNGSIPVYNAKSDFDFESLVRQRPNHLALCVCVWHNVLTRAFLGPRALPGMDRA